MLPRLRAAGVTLFLLLLGGAGAPQTPPGPGIDVRHYDFTLRLSDTSDRIEGEAALDIHFTQDGLHTFALDLIGRTPASGDTGMAVSEVRGPGGGLAFQQASDRLQIRLATPTVSGEDRTFIIRYSGVPRDGLIISSNKYGERTFFGDNWPDRARYWLPTVDHPSDKASVTFTVTAPDRYQVVANGRLTEETDVDGGMRRTRWEEPAPLPTKVMVIGVARFAVQHLGETEGVPIQSWVYPQDREAGFSDYARAPRIVDWYVQHIGPFPYAKLADVQSRTRYGGMENAGAIFYSETSVTGDGSNEGLLAHEIAHQWFGDSASEKAWHHIWLSEGFATYFTHLYMEGTYGRDRLVARMQEDRRAVVRYALRNPTSAVVDTTITDLNSLLSTNSYQKGSWVLHMLRSLIGDEAFWEGIRTYYERFRDGNALTSDFESVMEEVSGQGLDWFFDQWVFQPGVLQIEAVWGWDRERKQVVLDVDQVQRTGTIYRMPMEVEITDADGSTWTRVVVLTQAQDRLTIRMEAPPASIALDPGTLLLYTGTIRERDD